MTNLQTISVEQFYTQQLAPTAAAEQPYTIAHVVDGQHYTLSVSADGKVDVTQGDTDTALMTSIISESDWREVISGQIEAGSILPLPERVTAAQVEKIRSLRGKLDLTLNREGEPWQCTAIFNGVETPSVALQMSADDFAAIQRGELNSQMAFMTGKLKFQGDMGLLLKLGSLLG